MCEKLTLYSLLNPYIPNVTCYTPENIRTSSGFLMIGGIEMFYREQIG